MESGKHDVFISYRRDGGSAEARLIRSALSERGLDVFLDVTDLKQGHFDLALLDRIARARSVVLILSPHSLDRCSDDQDWLLREIAHAIQTRRNVIPIMLPGFEFPPELPSAIEDLPRYQAIQYSHVLFDATLGKLLDAIGAGGAVLKPKIAYYRFADYLWTRLGARRVLPLVCLLALPILTYSLLQYSVNSTVPKLIGDFGVDFQADDWSLHPLTLTGVAQNVRLRPPHDRAATPVFSADEVEFSGTLGTVLSGLGRDLLSLSTLGWLDLGQPFNEIRVKHGEIHLELSTNGQLNWSEFWDAVPQARKEQLKRGLFPVNAVLVDGLKISYIEHIPERSGGGVIQTSQAHIDIDDVSGSIVDLSGRGAFKFTGRSAGGLITLSGNAMLSPRARQPSIPSDAAGSEPAGTAARPSSGDVPYFPHFPAKMGIFLENVGAGAFARAIPDSTGIVATSGSLRGSIDVDVGRDHYDCRSNVEMNDVRLAPNPRVIVVKSEFDRVQRDLAAWKTSGRFDACRPFEQEPSARATTSRASILVAAFNTQATVSAPPSARAVAFRDQQTLTGAVVANAALNDAVDRLGGEAAQRATTLLGPRTGSLVQQALISHTAGRSNSNGQASPAPGQSDGDNPLAKGAKSIGHGFKKLFGRNKDDDKKKQPR